MKTSILIFAFFFTFIQYKTPPADKMKKLDELVSEYISGGFFSGSVIISKDGKTVFEKDYGFENKDGKKLINKNTRFGIASASKMFTALSILKFVENGKLKLEDKLSTLLPEYPFPNASEITLYMLLSHTSGLHDYMLHPDYEERRKNFKSIDDYLKIALEVPHAALPGEKFVYSNTGYLILQKITELISGKNYFDYIRETIWQPLQMTNTEVYFRDNKNCATGYDYLPTGEIFQSENDNSIEIFTTSADMMKFAEALRTDKLLSSETKKVMLGIGDNVLSSNSYGLGFSLHPIYGSTVFGHSGDSPGFCADVFISSAKGYSTVVLSNYSIFSRGLHSRIMQVLNGEDYSKPVKPVSFAIIEALKESGSEYVLNNFQSMLTSKGYTIPKGFGMLNNLGVMLLEKGSINEAIVLFKVNASLFPGELICWLNLGETYSESGDKIKAAECFKKALEISPDNPNAKELLSKLG